MISNCPAGHPRHRAQTWVEDCGLWSFALRPSLEIYIQNHAKTMARRANSGGTGYGVCVLKMKTGNGQKIIKNRPQNQPKMDPKSLKMRVRRGLGCPGGRSGSHVGPQGRPGAPTCPKTTFEVPPGTPFGGQFSVLFSIFRCFCGMLFLRAVLEGFRERFRVDFGTILEGFFRVLSYNFRCALHIAEPHLDMVFVMFEAHQRFQESSQK